MHIMALLVLHLAQAKLDHFPDFMGKMSKSQFRLRTRYPFSDRIWRAHPHRGNRHLHIKANDISVPHCGAARRAMSATTASHVIRPVKYGSRSPLLKP